MLLISGGLRAQFPLTYNDAIPVSYSYDQVDRSGNPFIINYDMSDELIFGVNYARWLNPIHARYDTTSLNYALFAVDSIISTDNTYFIPFSAAPGIVLDSVDIVLAHVNHSSQNDTLVLTILKLDNNNFPNDSVKMVDTVVLGSPLSPGNFLTNLYTYRWYTNYDMNDQPFGIKIEFFGSLQDTMAILNGHGKAPMPNTCMSLGYDDAIKSFFYPNSYGYYAEYNLILPTAAGGDIFIDCNLNSMKDSLDSESYLQNWSITSYVSAPEIGLDDEETIHLTIYPNPAGNIVYFGNVDKVDAVNVFNASGALVKSANSVNKLEITDLPNGIYIFALQHEKNTVYKKLVVHK